MPQPTDTPTAGIIHLGLGAFFRGFGCVYVADAMEASGGDWGIIGVSLRSAAVRDALKPRNWAYTCLSLAPEREALRDIRVLTDVLVAPEDPLRVLQAMADPAIRIVSLTVTEKGYCHDPVTGALNSAHPDIVHDLTYDLPVSAPGFLLRGLQMRFAAGHAPFTVLCCDNLPDNGKLLRAIVLEMAQQVDPALAAWIAEQGRFPCTMVDRITPAVTAADVARVTRLCGYAEAAPVLHEPFSQWAIEDDFVGGARPDLATAGAELVADVAAHEQMKLRMLNGAHSALAYAGYLGGHQTIAQTVADPVFAAYLRRLWEEIMPAVTAPEGVDLSAYAEALFARFSNTAIHHKTWQIAMDGSQKVPQRLLQTIAHNLEDGRDVSALSFAVAAWMRYACGTDEVGHAIDVRDPMADRFQQISKSAKSATEVTVAFLELRDIFSAQLAQSMQSPLVAAADRLWSLGARAAAQEVST